MCSWLYSLLLIFSCWGIGWLCGEVLAMTVNALSMVDQVLAGYAYKHYFAREIYYNGTQNGPHVIVYLSDDVPILNSATNIWTGPGLRVECYTSMTTNLGAARLTVANHAGGNISWGVQDLVLADCQPTLIGGVRYDLPASGGTANTKANMAAAAADFSTVFLGFFACFAFFWNIFRRR